MRIFVILLIISIIASIVLSIPQVQTKLAHYFTEKVNKKKNVNIAIDKIQITLSGKIILKNFLVLDEKKDTIFEGKRLETHLKNPFNISKTNKMSFGNTTIDGLHSKIIIYKGSKKTNVEIFGDKLDDSKPRKKSDKHFVLQINKINLINSRLSYFDKNIKDEAVLDFKYFHSEINKFKTIGAEIYFSMLNSSFLENHNIKIQNLTTDFSYTKKQISLDNFKLDTDQSSIDMNMAFTANPDYKNFNNKVKISGKIDEAFLNTNDLRKFTGVFAPNHKLSFHGDLSGTINDLIIKGLEVVADNNIDMEGNLKLHRMFDSKQIKVVADFKRLNFSFKELNQLLKPVIKNSFPQNLLALNRIKTKGQLTYFPEHIQSKMKVSSDFGLLDFDMKMSNFSSIDKTKYTAHIISDDFDLNKLTGMGISKLKANLKVSGAGLNLKSVNTKFEGTISQVEFNQYLYKNLGVNGIFKNKQFEGWFDVNDNNLSMDFNGLIDFSHHINRMKFRTEICAADLVKINLIKRDSIANFSGNIVVDAQGNNLDDIIGKLTLNDVSYTNKRKNYKFKNFVITSEKKDSIKTINFISNDVISGNITGHFGYKNIPLLVKNALGSVFANYKTAPLKEHQFMKYKLKIYNKITDLLVPDLSIADNTSIKGKLDSKDNLFKLKLKSQNIKYGKNNLKKVNFDLDNKNLLYNIYLKVDTIKTGFYTFNQFRLLNTTIKDTLYLKTKFSGGKKYKDHYDLAFFYTMDKMQNFVFGLQKSLLNFKDISWKIDPKINKNRIYYAPAIDSLNVNDVGIINGEEQLKLNGSKHKHKIDLNLLLSKINLQHLSPEQEDFDFQGLVNGNVQIKTFGKEILPLAQLNIQGFKVNNEDLGIVNMKVNTLKGNVIFIDAGIKKQGITLAKINGFTDFGKKKPLLNGSIFLQEFPVKPLAPLFKDIFGNIRGNWTGNIQVKGPLNNLDYQGKIYLRDFGLKVLSLNVDYQFDNKAIVRLKKQSFIFDKAKFEDTKTHTKGTLTGYIKHHNFNNWYLDLGIKTDKILVLDTPENPEELYYGQIVVKGDARIYGYVNRLKIDANMQTKKGTNFVLTLNDIETEGENDFIHIVSKANYKKQKTKRFHKIYEGVEMNFDLDITPEAKVRIILDQEFGSYLEAQGSGGMLLEINTNGKFNIWGDFTVLKGIYNFKYAGVIDKKFDVEPGSYISWEGDPFGANLDIKAVYETIANPYVLLENNNQNSSQKNMPVKVIIFLKEKLLHPKITFDLDLPKANTILKSQIDYILSDPDRKNLQVISLLSFGSFINENDYNLNKQVAEGAVETISERGLNILNALMNQDENFKVNLKYKGGSNDANTNIKNDPQVGLSLTTKINKRVYINGSVAIPVGRYTKSSIVGDMEVEVYLDKQGNLKFRFFNKQTELEYIGQQEGYTQGMGLSYQVEFDTLKEILRRLGIKISENPDK